jgi:arsenate reductase-like glutaredoxin family protein
VKTALSPTDFTTMLTANQALLNKPIFVSKGCQQGYPPTKKKNQQQTED